MKKSLRVYTQEEPHNWQVAKGGTRVKHARELKGHASCCTTGQNFQSGKTVSSLLKLATRSSREPKHPVC